MKEINLVGSFGLFPTLMQIYDLSEHAQYNKVIDYCNKTQTSTHSIMKDSGSTYDESMGNNWLDNPIIKDFRQQIQDCVDHYSSVYKLKHSIIKDKNFFRILDINCNWLLYIFLVCCYCTDNFKIFICNYNFA